MPLGNLLVCCAPTVSITNHYVFSYQYVTFQNGRIESQSILFKILLQYVHKLKNRVYQHVILLFHCTDFAHPTAKIEGQKRFCANKIKKCMLTQN